MSAATLARDLVVAQTRALKLPGVARKDIVRPRLIRVGAAKLRQIFPKAQMPFVANEPDTDESVYVRAEEFVADKFGGYSIYHVDGRFRAGGLPVCAALSQQSKNM